MTAESDIETPEIKTATAQMIEEFALCRSTWFLDEQGFEVHTSSSPAGSHSATSEQITLSLSKNDGRELKFIATIIKGAAPELYVRLGPGYDGLIRDQRHFVLGLIASYCDPRIMPNIQDGNLKDYSSREVFGFFDKLYNASNPSLDNAIRILRDFEARKKSGESPAFH